MLRGLLPIGACALGAGAALAAPPLPRPKPAQAQVEVVPLPRPKPETATLVPLPEPPPAGSRARAESAMPVPLPERPPAESRVVALPPQFNPVEEPKPLAEGDEADRCLEALRADGVEAERAETYESKGHCVIDDPVLVRSVDSPAGKVEFPAGPLLNCRFASTLAGWIRGIVTPVGAQLMSSPVAIVDTGPGYVCRNMNSAAQGKRSAHAIGNALDLVGFRLADGRRILIENYDSAKGREREFLVALRTSACGYFLTVLGPGSDAAHGNHLHIDLAQAGRSANYRICE